MRRTTTDEERDLFLLALSGRLPAKRTRTKSAKPAAVKAVKPLKKTAEKSGEVVPRGRRHTTAEEEELFLFAIAGRTPVKETKPAAKNKTPTPPPQKPPKPSPGVDGNTLRKLTRGEIAPTAKLDLHGLTENAAHGALTAFLLAAHRRGDRLVLVVTGKGSGGVGVLRRMVPRWIEEAPMTKVIAEKRWAHRRHGGEGALYIYLRKRSA